jgi:hypothetical protein
MVSRIIASMLLSYDCSAPSLSGGRGGNVCAWVLDRVIANIVKPRLIN